MRMLEQRYSFLHTSKRGLLKLDIETGTQVSDFEQRVQQALSEASDHLRNEEFGLALAAYNQLAALILHTMDPRLPVGAATLPGFVVPVRADLIDALSDLAIRKLRAAPMPDTTVPREIVGTTRLPQHALREVERFADVGPRVVVSGRLPVDRPVIDRPVVIGRPPIDRPPIGRPPIEVDPTPEPAPPSPPATRATIVGLTTRVAISLGDDGVAELKNFLDQRRTSIDLGIIDGFTQHHAVASAFLPHLYSFVIPMALGDCHAGLGALAQAETSYLSVLGYPFINEIAELPVLWMRLAELYLERGDDAYRQGGNHPMAWEAARDWYERIVTRGGAVPGGSALYADARFAPMRARVESVLAAADPLALDDNPAFIAIVLRARQRLTQISSGLNFFGFAPGYLPPFSFEYLQNTARYLAQQAGRIAQLYVNFKSRAESEQLSRDQLDQQADVARASVELERLGADEARAGLRTANASRAYADQQRANAGAARQAFQNARAELAELAELEAWASASSVDRDDQVKLTISGYSYYSADSKRRNVVIQELARQRTRLSHGLEAGRLDREIASADAYRAVAQAQVAQAEARVAVADMRVQIAGLQHRFAQDNRDFVDGKEFSARAWYEMARAARRLTSRYLDMATEAAFLMERAYFLETGRDLHRIRFDAASSAATGLAGELLQADIDSFTQDHLATTRSRKAPVKHVVSLADLYPQAFYTLKASGRCSFETTLAQFERAYPGAWLAKIRNVEVVFVGLGSSSGIRGTLRTGGLSHMRDLAGAAQLLAAPPDVLPLSQYEVRQDALLFRFTPNELRVFENCGIATEWQLDLPLDANDFDLGDVLDVQLVLYYDAFYDTQLEAAVRAALPEGGEAARAFSMAVFWPDELFYLRNQGEGRLVFDAGLVPRSQTAAERSALLLRCVGEPAAVAGRQLILRSAELGAEITVTTDADGLVDAATPGSPLAALLGRALFDRWDLTFAPGGDLAGLRDVQVYIEYRFRYRTGA